MPEIIEGTNKREKQNEQEVTYAYNITHEEEKIDFTKSAETVRNLVRGLSPAPGAYTTLEGKVLKIYQVEIGGKATEAPGTITDISKEGIKVACQDLEIIIKEIKPEGKKKMDIKDYVNGVDKKKLLDAKME